jgi:hypothetical protein
MPCRLALLTCLFLVGCGGATQAVRPATVQKRFCVYLPHRGAAAALDEGDGDRPEFLRELSWSQLEPVSAPTTARSHEAWPWHCSPLARRLVPIK